MVSSEFAGAASLALITRRVNKGAASTARIVATRSATPVSVSNFLVNFSPHQRRLERGLGRGSLHCLEPRRGATRKRH